MKKVLFFSFLLMIFFIASCSHEEKDNLIDLNRPWKFKTGDSLSWAAQDYNDNKWDTINPTEIWENQGYKNYNGYAWYRVKVIIPASLKQNGLVKDSIRFSLGKIDDCDQVFLNGEMIGENGKSILQKEIPSDAFIKVEGVWSMNRRYVLNVNDPRILWDKENVIAVRSYDQQGAGGMFSKPFEISMVGLKDYVKFDFTSNGFVYTGDSMISKKINIKNISGKDDFKGILTVDVFSRENGNLVSGMKADMVLLKNSNNDFSSMLFPAKADLATLLSHLRKLTQDRW
jgi:alpha-galactosidase